VPVCIHYVILALSFSLFLMRKQKKSPKKMYHKRKGKQTYFLDRKNGQILNFITLGSYNSPYLTNLGS
jgi:hypothetical protein